MLLEMEKQSNKKYYVSESQEDKRNHFFILKKTIRAKCAFEEIILKVVIHNFLFVSFFFFLIFKLN